MGLDVHVLVLDRFLGDEVENDIDERYTKISHDSVENEHYVSGYYSQKDAHHFRVGAYSSFSEWRRELTTMMYNVEWDTIRFDHKFDSVPFIELLRHSDCEGEIDYKLAAKLYEDFKNCLSILDGVTDDFAGEYFKEKYFGWMETFKIAAENRGRVLFS